MLVSYKEIKPSEPLDRFVKCFWMLEKNYTNSLGYETIYPDGCLDLVFIQADNKQTTLFIGQQSKRFQLPYSGSVRSIGIRFFPFGAYPIFKIPIHEITGLILSLNEIFGNTFNDLSDLIFSLSAKEAIEVLEKFLLKKLLANGLDIEQVKYAAEFLYSKNGHVRIDLLADKVNVSPRTMERRFESITGLSPKSLARIFRFNKVKNELTLDPFKDLTSLCYEYNYFDQSHFTKDFKQIAMLTPTEFANEVKIKSIFFYK